VRDVVGQQLMYKMTQQALIRMLAYCKFAANSLDVLQMITDTAPNSFTLQAAARRCCTPARAWWMASRSAASSPTSTSRWPRCPRYRIASNPYACPPTAATAPCPCGAQPLAIDTASWQDDKRPPCGEVTEALLAAIS
jgi:hypothetical protein